MVCLFEKRSECVTIGSASSLAHGTTLGIIPLKAFEGKGVLYDTPGVFLHHRMNSILGGDDIKRFKLGGSLVRFAAKPRVADEATDRASFAGLSLLWGPLMRVDVTEATANTGLVFYGPKGMRVTVVETSSLPDPAAAPAAEEEAEEEKARRRLAGVTALVAEAEAEAAEAGAQARVGAGGGAVDGGSADDRTNEMSPEAASSLNSPDVAPSAAAAMMEWQEISMQSPAQISPYEQSVAASTASTTGAAVDDDEEEEEGKGEKDGEERVDVGGGLYQRLVKEVRFESPEGDAYGPLHDLSVSGMGGWIRVMRVSRKGDCDISVKVWGPRGLEVFVRTPMPTAL